jgi:flagellar P-ring protein precursor FlgI
VYAVAQGPVVTGGFATGRGGTSQTVNHPTVGRSPNGAIVERVAPSLTPRDVVRLQLRQSDFTTSARIVEAVNKRFAAPPLTARSENAGLISVTIPPEYRSRPTEFVAELESLLVEADRPARVVINERTGTIVLGKDVRIAPVGILHGNLSVEVQTTFGVSQPSPLSPQGTTEVVPQTAVTTKEEKARSVILKQGATVEELVRALSAIGSTPRDVIAILQSLRSAGALEGEVEVI